MELILGLFFTNDRFVFDVPKLTERQNFSPCGFDNAIDETYIFFGVDLHAIEKRLTEFAPRRKHDAFAVEAIKEAVRALGNGNWGMAPCWIKTESLWALRLLSARGTN